MQTLSKKKQVVLVLISGLIFGWVFVAHAQLVPQSKRSLDRQRQSPSSVVRQPSTPSVVQRSAGGVIQLKGTKIDVKVQKPQVQLFSARRKPAMGRGELERAFRETLRGASAWGRGHVPKTVVRKTKGGKLQKRMERVQDVKNQQIQKKK